jgi:hypothetical protein
MVWFWSYSGNNFMGERPSFLPREELLTAGDKNRDEGLPSQQEIQQAEEIEKQIVSLREERQTKEQERETKEQKRQTRVTELDSKDKNIIEISQAEETADGYERELQGLERPWRQGLPEVTERIAWLKGELEKFDEKFQISRDPERFIPFSTSSLLREKRESVISQDPEIQVIDNEINQIDDEINQIDDKIKELELSYPDRIKYRNARDELKSEYPRYRGAVLSDYEKALVAHLVVLRDFGADEKRRQDYIASTPDEYHEFLQLICELNKDGLENINGLETTDGWLRHIEEKKNFLGTDGSPVDALKVFHVYRGDSRIPYYTQVHLEGTYQTMLQLESRKPGIVMFLFEKFGIREFNRYDEELLIAQYELFTDEKRMKDFKDDMKDGKNDHGYILYQQGLGDDNLAFFDSGRRKMNEQIKTLPLEQQQNYVAIFVEAEDRVSYIERSGKVSEALGKADVVVVSGHGESDSIRLGEGNNPSNRSDYLDFNYIQEHPSIFANLIEPSGVLILRSCKTGETSLDRNMAKEFSTTIPEVSIYAPDVYSGHESWDFVVGHDGYLKATNVQMYGSETWNGRDSGVNEARLYRGGELVEEEG